MLRLKSPAGSLKSLIKGFLFVRSYLFFLYNYLSLNFNNLLSATIDWIEVGALDIILSYTEGTEPNVRNRDVSELQSEVIEITPFSRLHWRD